MALRRSFRQHQPGRLPRRDTIARWRLRYKAWGEKRYPDGSSADVGASTGSVDCEDFGLNQAPTLRRCTHFQISTTRITNRPASTVASSSRAVSGWVSKMAWKKGR